MLSEDGPLVLRGRPYAAIIPRIDGETADEALVATLGSEPSLEGWVALERLQRLGCVTRERATMAESHRSLLVADGPPVEGLDLHWHVATPSLGAPPWSRSGRAPLPSDDTLVIVFADDYLAEEVAAVHRALHPLRRPWLPVRPVGGSLWIGPMIGDVGAPCWRCLAHALRRNRPVEAYLASRGIPDGGPPLARGAVAPAALASALDQAVRGWRSGATPHPLAGRLVEIAPDGTHVAHTVSLRPQCPACGDASLYARSALHALDALKRSAAEQPPDRDAPTDAENDGTLLLHQLQRLVSPITGIATSLVRVPHRCGDGIALHVATQSRIRPDASVDSLLLDATQRAAGKGRLDSESMIGALAEAVERASGTFAGDEPRQRATARTLGDRAIAPNNVALFSDRQFSNAAARTFIGRRPPAPLRFSLDLEIDWTPVWSITHERWRYLPTSSLYYDMPVAAHERIAVADSNGCAAGASFADATVRAILELIERDAVAIWWYNRVSRPEVSLDVHTPWIAQLRATYSRLGREFWCLDLTTDLGIPVCAAVSRRRDTVDERILLGFGAGLTLASAAERALLEMNQLLAALDAAGDQPPPDREFAEWLATANVTDSPHLVPHHGARGAVVRTGADARDPHMALEDLHAALRGAGLELLVLDQSRPDIGVRVARAIVPGLRHFWPRLAPGRLFDVPVRLGWRTSALQESELNPVAIFL